MCTCIHVLVCVCVCVCVCDDTSLRLQWSVWEVLRLLSINAEGPRERGRNGEREKRELVREE